MPADLHNRELPRWLRDVLAAVPLAGTGLHQFINSTAWHLMPWRSNEDAAALLLAATAHCGRDTRREIADAVQSARAKHNAGAGWHPGQEPASPAAMPLASTSRWPKRDDTLMAGVMANGPGLYDLWELSPWRFEPENEIERGDLLEALFPGNPLLCIGWEKDAWRTLPLSEWCEAKIKAALQFIVPSPMTSAEGVTKSGKPTSKSNANTGPRRYVVVEFDFLPEAKPEDATFLKLGRAFGLNDTRDLCACLLHHLAEYGPLVLVVWSGGKSLQGWFPAIGEDEETIREFFHYACRIGADPATWTPSQFVRLPYGRRNNGNFQTPVFFNPQHLPPP